MLDIRYRIVKYRKIMADSYQFLKLKYIFEGSESDSFSYTSQATFYFGSNPIDAMPKS